VGRIAELKDHARSQHSPGSKKNTVVKVHNMPALYLSPLNVNAYNFILFFSLLLRNLASSTCLVDTRE
jgi:hypothetical protein